MMKIQWILKKPITAVILSIIIGFIVGGVILALTGFDPFQSYIALINGIFSRPKYISQVIIKSTPLILTGLSVAFAFKTGLFNIGAEGQYIIGTIIAVLVGYLLDLPPVVHFFVVIILASIISGLWGSIVGFLKAKFGIHEVITSIMFNWVAFYLNNYMVSLKWLRKPGADSSYPIKESAWNVVLNAYKTSSLGKEKLLNSNSVMSEILLKTDVNYGIFIAILVAFLVWILLKYTKKGFEFRAVGFNADASKFVGMNIKKTVVLSMFISGAIAGLAGALQITGTMPHRIGLLAAQEGYGFDGISVALIACSSPIGCIFSGLLFSALKYGGSSIQSQIGAPSEIINIVIGTIIFIISMSSIFKVLAGYIDKVGNIKIVKNKNKNIEGNL